MTRTNDDVVNKETLERVVKEVALTFGVPVDDLEREVKRELIARASKQVVEQVLKKNRKATW
jgi:hypothetical protein